MKIRGSIHRLLLGVSLIALASGVLLLSDWSHRRSGGSLLRRVAVFQHVSQPVLDEGIEGMLDAIAESGFIDGQNIEIRRFNAENDLPTANAAAFSYRPLQKGRIDLTATTRSLFEAETLLGLLHLIVDDRATVGVAESEFVLGACWIGPIVEVTSEKD